MNIITILYLKILSNYILIINVTISFFIKIIRLKFDASLILCTRIYPKVDNDHKKKKSKIIKHMRVRCIFMIYFHINFITLYFHLLLKYILFCIYIIYIESIIHRSILNNSIPPTRNF